MLDNIVGVSLWTKNLPFITSSDLLQVGDGRLHLDRLLGCCLEIYLTFSTVVVDGLLVLHEPAQVLYVRLQEHLGFQKASKILTKYLVTSAKGIVRLNRSQMSIILTYEVFGRAFDTLMNLFGKRAYFSGSEVSLTLLSTPA